MGSDEKAKPMKDDDWKRLVQSLPTKADSIETKIRERSQLACFNRNDFEESQVLQLIGAPDSRKLKEDNVRSDILIYKYGRSEIRIDEETKQVEKVTSKHCRKDN